MVVTNEVSCDCTSGGDVGDTLDNLLRVAVGQVDQTNDPKNFVADVFDIVNIINESFSEHKHKEESFHDPPSDVEKSGKNSGDQDARVHAECHHGNIDACLSKRNLVPKTEL